MPRIDGWALKTGDFPSLPPQLSMETTPPLGGRGAMTPGRGRCSEHTRMASSIFSSSDSPSLSSSLAQHMHANTGVLSLDADSIACHSCTDCP